MPMQRSRRSRTLKQYGSRRKSVMNTANKVVSALNTGVRFRNLAKGARNAYKRYQSSGSVVKAVLGSGSGGDYSQFTTAKMNTGRKSRVTLRSLTKELHSKNETTTIRYGGMNNFNDNGYYWCGKNLLVAGARTDLPVYMFDLTSCMNTGTAGISVNANPLFRANVAAATGVIGWSQGNSLQTDGVSTTTNWFHEKAPSTATSVITPHEKSRLLWTDVRMNLWGAKNKAIKYTVQVVKLLDDVLDPNYVTDTTAGAGFAKHNSFWQGMTKPYTYNPLALTSIGQLKGIKVLKTYETIIQPTSSTESDIDPHVKVLKWFMRWDREINYKETASRIGTASDLTEQADYAAQVTTCLGVTKPRAKLWVLIRASAYQSQTDAAVDNTVSPSFDMIVRANHVFQ